MYHKTFVNRSSHLSIDLNHRRTSEISWCSDLQQIPVDNSIALTIWFCFATFKLVVVDTKTGWVYILPCFVN